MTGFVAEMPQVVVVLPGIEVEIWPPMAPSLEAICSKRLAAQVLLYLEAYGDGTTDR